jgi:hypothetical protein
MLLRAGLPLILSDSVRPRPWPTRSPPVSEAAPSEWSHHGPTGTAVTLLNGLPPGLSAWVDQTR